MEEVAVLGKGSFGQVYLVKDSDGELFALKKVKLDPFSVDEAKKQIEVMALFEHPNLVRVHGSSFDQATFELTILMEYCEGGDLLSYFRKNNKLQSDQILSIFRQIVQGFLVLNAKGVIHRDLKPQNVLIGKNMIIKIADFGCARSLVPQQFSHVNNLSLDKGTHMYASPQQLQNEKYSAKCDVWSAGCLIYFLATGTHPFIERNNEVIDVIKQRTAYRSRIAMPKTLHPCLSEAISLTLKYQDKQRATWRQLWLARLFKAQVKQVKHFVEYLSCVSTIAEWIVKTFWKQRKQIKLQRHLQDTFVYFTCKYNYTCIQLALSITQKNEKWRYLFDQNRFKTYNAPSQTITKLKKYSEDSKTYYEGIKNYLQEHGLHNLISNQSKRKSCFADLDSSIRAASKILRVIQKNFPKSGDNRIWVIMARWINFDRQFDFQYDPRIEDLLRQQIKYPQKMINDSLKRFESGIYS